MQRLLLHLRGMLLLLRLRRVTNKLIRDTEDKG